MRNLLLSGGIRHDFVGNTEAVIEALSAIGVSSEQTTDISEGIYRLASETFDLVTVNALRWPMEGNPKYADLRDEFGYRMPPECGSILVDFIRGGGGLFGMHTACICFDDWDQWRDVIGGSWVWGQSFHPPVGPVRVSTTGHAHCLTNDLPVFTVIDEVYANLDLAPDISPLLAARADDGTEGPVLWARSFGEGRVVFDALGHDYRSLNHDVHRRVVQRCAAWGCGLSDQRVIAL